MSLSATSCGQGDQCVFFSSSHTSFSMKLHPPCVHSATCRRPPVVNNWQQRNLIGHSGLWNKTWIGSQLGSQIHLTTGRCPLVTTLLPGSEPWQVGILNPYPYPKIILSPFSLSFPTMPLQVLSKVIMFRSFVCDGGDVMKDTLKCAVKILH